MLPFNLGLPELLVIGVVALLIFGPKKLPELGRNLGKGINSFKKGLSEAGEEFKAEVQQDSSEEKK